MNLPLSTDVQDHENNSDNIGMYSFYDTESETHDTPFFCQNDMMAKRHHKLVVTAPGTMMESFRKSFNLVRIGWFNTQTGAVYNQHQTLVHGKFFELPKTKEKN
jgi:hypothetical protein